jgi:DNA-directed DNA polymerase
VGDSSDNIPGISGFGPKKAIDLLSKFDTLDGIFKNLDTLTPKMCE